MNLLAKNYLSFLICFSLIPLKSFGEFIYLPLKYQRASNTQMSYSWATVNPFMDKYVRDQSRLEHPFYNYLYHKGKRSSEVTLTFKKGQGRQSLSGGKLILSHAAKRIFPLLDIFNAALTFAVGSERDVGSHTYQFDFKFSDTALSSNQIDELTKAREVHLEILSNLTRISLIWESQSHATLTLLEH